jgi:hypothetical protein
MYFRATSLILAGIGAMALSAQTPPPARSPEAPQLIVAPQAPAIRAETERALRELLKKYSQGETGVCSIPLRAVAGSKDVERMPAIRPDENIDRMPAVKLPAPPCEEEKR